MLIMLLNQTGSIKTYVSGNVTLPASGSVSVSIQYQVQIASDGALRSDLIAGAVYLSDGTNTFGSTDAINYLNLVQNNGVAFGQATMANSRPIAIASDQTNLPTNITQFGGNNIVTGTGVSGSGIPRVTVANDSNILTTQSGTWNVTNISGTVSLPTGASTAANQAIEISSLGAISANTSNTNTSVQTTQGSVTSGTVALKSELMGGQYNSSLPSPSTTQQTALQQDYRARLLMAPFSYSYFHPIYTTRIQTTAVATSAASASLTATINATQAGSLLVVNAGRKTSTLTITDSASQIYSTIEHVVSGSVNNYLFYVPNSDAGVTSITITCTSGTDSLYLMVSEYTNMAIAPLDKSAGVLNSGITSWSSGATAATTQASELLIGTAMATLHLTTTFNPGTSWTSTGYISNTTTGSNIAGYMEEQYVASTATFAATGTNSSPDNIIANIATFKTSGLPASFTVINNPTIIKTGPGTLSSVSINTIGSGLASVTFYDGTSTAGTVIATLALTSMMGSIDYDLHFVNGLTMVVNSNSADFTVMYD